LPLHAATTSPRNLGRHAIAAPSARRGCDVPPRGSFARRPAKKPSSARPLGSSIASATTANVATPPVCALTMNASCLASTADRIVPKASYVQSRLLAQKEPAVRSLLMGFQHFRQIDEPACICADSHRGPPGGSRATHPGRRMHHDSRGRRADVTESDVESQATDTFRGGGVPLSGGGDASTTIHMSRPG
jgi:hypothetical protein